MAKNGNKLVSSVMWVIAVLAALAVGGLFTSGTTLSFPILELIPVIFHTVTGWIIIVGTLVGAILAIMKEFS